MNRHVPTKPSLEVDPWSDRIGTLGERFPGLVRRIGNWETSMLADRLEGIAIDRPIYVTGLARSGSTILLELLAGHADTATHRYRDFPLLAMPWAWNWFVDRAGSGEAEAVERAHKDRIKVTRESPEAFEEVIWMAFFDHLHNSQRSAVLDVATSNPDFEAFYRDHIRKLLVLRDGQRYLAKGNYNVTRIGYLRKLVPDALFVVPIRDPLWHIASLAKQHRLLSEAGKADEKVRRYMRRSGHFEFGLDRRVVNAHGGEGLPAAEKHWQQGEEVAGWASQWADIYGHVAELMDDSQTADAVKVVRYEDVCAEPVTQMRAILDHCGLSHDGLPEKAVETVAPPSYYEPSFTPEERAVIKSKTAAVAGRFGYA